MVGVVVLHQQRMEPTYSIRHARVASLESRSGGSLPSRITGPPGDARGGQWDGARRARNHHRRGLGSLARFAPSGCPYSLPDRCGLRGSCPAASVAVSTPVGSDQGIDRSTPILQLAADANEVEVSRTVHHTFLQNGGLSSLHGPLRKINRRLVAQMPVSPFPKHRWNHDPVGGEAHRNAGMPADPQETASSLTAIKPECRTHGDDAAIPRPTAQLRALEHPRRTWQTADAGDQADPKGGSRRDSCLRPSTWGAAIPGILRHDGNRVIRSLFPSRFECPWSSTFHDCGHGFL